MASTYLSRTPSSAGNRQTFTISVWVKRSNTNSENAICSAWDADNISSHFDFRFTSSDTLNLQRWSSNITTNRLFRDVSAFYHLVLAVDTTQATDTDRVKLYVNGVQETSFSSATYPNQNDTLKFNSNVAHNIGRNLYSSPSGLFDGSMTHFHFCDGTQYQASDFGESDSTSGIWKPKTAPSVTYGTNGFFLKMENSGAMGTDSSGNTNTFTVNGTLTQNVDTPSNNFATMNPLDNFYANGTFANGNNTVTSVSGDATYNTSTLGVSSGKFYWECKWSAQPTGSTNQVLIGITKRPTTNANFFLGMKAWTYAYMAASGAVLQSDSTIITYDTYSIGDIIGVALDLDNNRLYFSKNGVFQNSSNPANGTNPISITAPDSTAEDSGAYFAGFGDGNTNLQETGQFNFGQGYFGTTAVASAGTAPSEGGIFEYDCPSGYQALCTKGINSF